MNRYGKDKQTMGNALATTIKQAKTWYTMSKVKPLPCCSRCKNYLKKDCKDRRPSWLCSNFLNDGTAEDISLGYVSSRTIVI